MKDARHYLSTDNYTVIRKEYFTSVVRPALSSVERSVPATERTYLIAGKRIRLCFYSDILAEKMSHAFAHHETVPAGEEASLTVHLWDSESLGSRMAAPWSDSRYFVQETTAQRELESGFFGTYLFVEETLNLYDKESGTAYFWVRDARHLPDWISAAPLRTILHWFLSTQGIHLVHGAVVGLGGRAVLLGARGGSGKSTTALSCLLAGMDYLADDYVAVAPGAEPVAYSLYNSGKITPDTLRVFPELKEKIWNTESFGGEFDQGKAVVFLSKFFPKQMRDRAALSAVFVPVIKTETRIVPAGKTETMLALAPTSLFQLPLAASNKLSELKEIVSRVPCHILELGPDIRQVPRAIRDFLEAPDAL